MPLIAWAVAAYTAGLLAGFSAIPLAWVLACCLLSAAASLRAARQGHLAPLALSLVVCVGAIVGREHDARDDACRARATTQKNWSVARSRTPCRAEGSGGAVEKALAAWRERTGATIDTLFKQNAGVVRALLVADTRSIPTELRDRFASAGLVHLLSISGLHVAIVAEAVMLAFELAGFRRRSARMGALALTIVYVAAIGAPPPAVRSAAMLGVATVTRLLQRPVSPWASLALGAGAGLVDPRVATDLGWQLSVAGFAALIAAGSWSRRHLPREWRGWRRTIARDVVISVLATLVTAPLVAWTFGRVSVIAPLTNIAAGPVVGLLQPMLFLAMVLAPVRGLASFVADAAHPLLSALNAIAATGAAVPFAAPAVSPSLVVAVAGGVAALAALVAASSRSSTRPLTVAALAVVTMTWWPLAPAGDGVAELHVIDVGQGDALAIRTPHGQWILVDAGRTWRGGDAGRTTILPYVRRHGGDVALFVLSHPHADHVGGAASLLRSLRPTQYIDAAFAGGSAPYRASLLVASQLGIPWSRVRAGDSLIVDGVVLKMLAPDSAWTASLTDPNLASTVLSVRYGKVRMLLTGDAEKLEEEWLLRNVSADELRADVLKVGHHGSPTSSSAAFLDAVRPRLAVVSVGAGNSYGHPGAGVLRELLGRGAAVLRTDQLGTVVVRTDGTSLTVAAAGWSWQLPRSSAFPP